MANWTDYIMNAIKPVQKMDLPRAQTPKFQGPIYTANTKAKGLVVQGNTDLSQLPVIHNPNGSYSTVHSMGFQDENPKSPYYGKQVLARGIVNGVTIDDERAARDKAYDEQQAQAVRDEYYRTGKHLGIFDTPENSNLYGQQLHEDWEKGFIPGVKMGRPQ